MGYPDSLLAGYIRNHRDRNIRRRSVEGKRFLSGTLKKGSFHLIGGQPSDRIVIAEGFATAASICEALQVPVAVAFDAGNLKEVAMAIQQRWPDSNLIIAGDNDKSGVGQEKAEEAGAEVHARVVIPAVPGDWNDIFNASGPEAVRVAFEAVAAVTPPAKPKLPAGFSIRKEDLIAEV